MLQDILVSLEKASCILKKFEQAEKDGEDKDMSTEFRDCTSYLYSVLDFTYYLLYCHFANGGKDVKDPKILQKCGFPYKSGGVKTSSSKNQDQEHTVQKEMVEFLFKTGKKHAKFGKCSHFREAIGRILFAVQPHLPTNSAGNAANIPYPIVNSKKQEYLAILHYFRNQTTHRGLVKCKLEALTAQKTEGYDQQSEEGVTHCQKYMVEIPLSVTSGCQLNDDNKKSVVAEVLSKLIDFVKDTTGELLSAAYLLPQDHGIARTHVKVIEYSVKPFPQVELPFDKDYLALKQNVISTMRKKLNVEVEEKWGRNEYSFTATYNSEVLFCFISENENDRAAIEEVMKQCIHFQIIKFNSFYS